MKKYILFGVIMLILSAVTPFVMFRMSDDKNAEIVSESIKVGQLAVKTRTNSGVSVSTLSARVDKKRIKTQLEKQIIAYEELGTTRFDIEEFKSKSYGDTGLQDSETGSAPNADSPESVEVEVEDTPDDSRVVKVNDNTAYMLVKDFDFQMGVDYVRYKGITLEIPQSDVPETYDNMKKNPDNIYNYKKYLHQDNFVDVLFESVRDGENIIVRVYNDGNKVTHYEVM